MHERGKVPYPKLILMLEIEKMAFLDVVHWSCIFNKR